MFRMALHSTVLTHALYSAGGGTLQRLSHGNLVLYSTRWVLYSTQPTQYFYSTEWVFSPVLLQHWGGTLQHPKVPILTGLRGYFTAPTILRYFTAPCYDQSVTLYSIVAIKFIPALRYATTIHCYLCV